MINKLLESYRQLFFTPSLTGSCLTNVSNNGCIIIMNDKTNLPTQLSDCPSSVYFYKVWVNQTRYELTKLGRSWPNQVQVDFGGTNWPKNAYELTKNGYELTKVLVDYGRSWPVTMKKIFHSCWLCIFICVFHKKNKHSGYSLVELSHLNV